MASGVTLPGQSESAPGRKPRKLTYWQSVARVGVQVAEQMVSDRVRVKQILVNLVSNAIQFTPSGAATVEVDHDPARDWFRIAVIDTGLGISERDAASIFEPFDQVQSAVAQGSAGTGLGLAIVRRLCHLLGGTVTLRSELGRGSRFTVEVPRVLPVTPAPWLEPAHEHSDPAVSIGRSR